MSGGVSVGGGIYFLMFARLLNISANYISRFTLMVIEELRLEMRADMT